MGKDEAPLAQFYDSWLLGSFTEAKQWKRNLNSAGSKSKDTLAIDGSDPAAGGSCDHFFSSAGFTVA